MVAVMLLLIHNTSEAIFCTQVISIISYNDKILSYIEYVSYKDENIKITFKQ